MPIPMTPSLRCLQVDGLWRLLLAVRAILIQICDQVLHLLLVLDTRKYHLGALHDTLRVLQILYQRRLVPGETRVLVCRRVVVVLDRASFSPYDPVKLGADPVLCGGADLVASAADRELLLSCRGILRHRRRGYGDNEEGSEKSGTKHDILPLCCWPLPDPRTRVAM